MQTAPGFTCRQTERQTFTPTSFLVWFTPEFCFYKRSEISEKANCVPLVQTKHWQSESTLYEITFKKMKKNKKTLSPQQRSSFCCCCRVFSLFWHYKLVGKSSFNMLSLEGLPVHLCLHWYSLPTSPKLFRPSPLKWDAACCLPDSCECSRCAVKGLHTWLLPCLPGCSLSLIIVELAWEAAQCGITNIKHVWYKTSLIFTCQDEGGPWLDQDLVNSCDATLLRSVCTNSRG